MHPERRKRLILVVFIVCVSTMAIGLAAFALRDNINLFYAPTAIASGEAPRDMRIRAGGMVVPGSVVRDPQSLAVTFRITDGEGEVEVEYTGILPDLFAENEAAVVTGMVNQQGRFMATEVLAKHDETYMPVEVEEAMQQAHDRRDAARAAGESEQGYQSKTGDQGNKSYGSYGGSYPSGGYGGYSP